MKVELSKLEMNMILTSLHKDKIVLEKAIEKTNRQVVKDTLIGVKEQVRELYEKMERLYDRKYKVNK